MQKHAVELHELLLVQCLKLPFTHLPGLSKNGYWWAKEPIDMAIYSRVSFWDFTLKMWKNASQNIYKTNPQLPSPAGIPNLAIVSNILLAD